MTPMATSPIDVDLQPRALRNEMLFVRVTKDERLAIGAAAADAGMTIVGFIRGAIREAILARRPVEQKPSPRPVPPVKKQRRSR